MKFSNSFEIPIPVDDAWPLLLDIEGIAPCMPGAELTEVVDKLTYKGKVSVRLGPVMLAFDGTARFAEIDERAHLARVEAMGTDKKGRGGANARVTFRLRPRDDATTVLVDTDLQLSGSVAQYGRGSGIIAEVANQLVGQFADRLSSKIAGAALAGPETERPAVSASAAANKPISGIALGLRILWSAVARCFKRLFGRT